MRPALGAGGVALLPDILASGLDVFFCGTAAGNRSVERGHYYAGQGNRFWSLIHEIGITSRLLNPEEDQAAPQFGIGLTDLAKGASGMDRDVPHSAYVPSHLSAIVEEHHPKIVAFNGLKAARIILGQQASYGRYSGAQRPDLFTNQLLIWVLPSTSGAARGYFQLEPWLELSEAIARSRREHGKQAS